MFRAQTCFLFKFAFLMLLAMYLFGGRGQFKRGVEVFAFHLMTFTNIQQHGNLKARKMRYRIEAWSLDELALLHKPVCPIDHPNPANFCAVRFGLPTTQLVK